MIEIVALKFEGEIRHTISIELDDWDDGIVLTARYIAGDLNLLSDSEILTLRTSYLPEAPEFDEGHVQISTGRIELSRPELRGIGLTSLLMRPIVRWIKRLPEVPVWPISLAGDDAETQTDMLIRNRFYEKLGFRFLYEENCNRGECGESIPMGSHRLISPPLKLSRNWTISSVCNRGSVL